MKEFSSKIIKIGGGFADNIEHKMNVIIVS